MPGGCVHPAYVLSEDVLVCVNCGEPSSSSKWPENVYGSKAVEQGSTKNKGRFWPAESKRMSGRKR